MAVMSNLKALALMAERDPHCPVIIDGDRVVTRAAFDASTNRLAREFLARGVQPGDFVSIILPNCVAFLESVAAAWKVGAVPQPLPAKLAAKELREIIALANPALIVGNPPGRTHGRAILPQGFVPDAAISAAPLPDVVAPHFKAMVSGGSTGRPKIIVAGNPGVIDPDAPMPTVRPNERFLVTGPLYHNAPFLAATTCILAGGCAVLMPHFDAELTLQMIERHKINFMSLVPTMMHRIWRLGAATRGAYDMSSIRAMIHSASMCPIWLKECWIEWLGAARVLEAYSSTEAPGYTVITGTEWLQRRGSVGRPDTTACQVGIFDAAGNRLGPYKVGEVYMRPTPGPDSKYHFGQKYHYIGAKSKTLPGGWDCMGDLGYVDADGYLYLSDRSADVIIRGGANIYPAEVEAAIDSHPTVRSSVVIGIPDDDLGETLLAIVDSPRPVSADEMRTYLRRHLSPYKIPQRFEFVTSPIRDDAGKVRRQALRQERIAASATATAA